MSASTHFATQPAYEAPGAGNFYLASNFTYCERTEATCQQCRAGWVNAYPDGYVGSQSDRKRQTDNKHHSSTNASSLICYGANGCICLAYCELPRYRASLPDTCATSATGYPPSPVSLSPSAQPTSFNGDSNTIVVWVQFLFALMALLVVLIPIVMACRRQIRTKQSKFTYIGTECLVLSVNRYEELTFITLVAVALLLVPLDIFYAVSYQDQEDQPQQIHQQQQRRNGQPRGPPLTLGGWLDDREKLTSNSHENWQLRAVTSNDSEPQISSEEGPSLLFSSRSSTPRPSDGIEAAARNDHLR